MPEIDGFEALRRLKESELYADIPVMFLTSMTDAAVEAKGFELGVVDFVSKPFSAPVLINRIKTHLNIDELIRERTARLQALQNGIVYVLADMVENRDYDTGGHVGRTTLYVEILLNAMMKNNVHAEEIKTISQDSFISSARLHDVGQIAISDIILNKPGKLTNDEFELMKRHTIEGEKIIEKIVSFTGNVDFLHNAKSFTSSHHERWDGSGYPHGLKGYDIPLQGRVMAIADVYDALISERPYKKSYTHRQACEIIQESAGTHFEPALVDLFVDAQDEFELVMKG
jgi:putative two-component system response regulator